MLIEINKLNQSIYRKRYKVKYTDDENYLNFIFYIINNINRLCFITN